MTPTVAKIVNKIAKGEKTNKVSNTGIPIFNNQTLKKMIASTLDTAEAIRRTLGDMWYPRSSASPTEKTGAADSINNVSSSVLRSNTTASGMKPKDKLTRLLQN